VIQRAYITEWRTRAPWPTDAQVEQDLAISRAIVEIFSDPSLAGSLAFRGGTALHKLYLAPATRYSEDIDLVQVQAGPIGAIMDGLRRKLDSWLGEPRRNRSEGRMAMVYRFDSEIPPITPLRLKVEVNTREHFSVAGFKREPFSVDSRWFQGSADLKTYALEELLATKLRALYQRSKGRDLYDLAVALERFPKLDLEKTVECYQRYIEHEGNRVSRAEFEANMAGKITDPAFHEDIEPLLVVGTLQASAPDDASLQTGTAPYDSKSAYRRVHEAFITRLPGDPWRGPE